jgi:hypothetical protein
VAAYHGDRCLQRDQDDQAIEARWKAWHLRFRCIVQGILNQVALVGTQQRGFAAGHLIGIDPHLEGRFLRGEGNDLCPQMKTGLKHEGVIGAEYENGSAASSCAEYSDVGDGRTGCWPKALRRWSFGSRGWRCGGDGWFRRYRGWDAQEFGFTFGEPIQDVLSCLQAGVAAAQSQIVDFTMNVLYWFSV